MKNKILFALITLGLSAVSISSASAQTINRNQQNEPFQSNEQNPLYGDGFNPMQLIHNANMMNRRSGGAFFEDSNRGIDNAAKSFREQQQQRLMEMRQNQNEENQLDSQDTL